MSATTSKGLFRRRVRYNPTTVSKPPPRLPPVIDKQVIAKIDPSTLKKIENNLKFPKWSYGGGGGGGGGEDGGGGGERGVPDPLVNHPCMQEMLFGYALTHYWEGAKYQLHAEQNTAVNSAPYGLPDQECKTKCQKLGKKLAEFELDNWESIHGQLSKDSVPHRLMELLGMRNSVKDREKANLAQRNQRITE